MSVNIGAGNADDAFYRYKMPKLQARIEGRGNGIKTNVVNNCDIAKALDRPPDYILKYFGCELGALTTYDAKTNTCIVNGAHDTGKLVEKLEGFIKKYVQCYQCGNPETVFKIKKDSIKMKCKACGGESVIDMSQERHSRLNNYIIKHPPEPKVSKAEKKLQKAEKERLKGLDDTDKKEKKEKKTKDKKDKKAEKESKDDKDMESKAEEDADEESPDEPEDDGQVEWMADTSEEAARQRAKEQLTAATAAMVHVPTPASPSKANGQHAEEEEAEKRKAAEAERKKEEARQLEETRRKLAVVSPEEESDEEEEDVVEELRELAAKVSPEKMASALQAVSKNIEGGVIGLMTVLYQALFGEPGKNAMAALVKKHAALLKLHAENETQQLAQLMAMEHLLIKDIPERSKEVEGMLTALHELDIVSDDVMQAWRNKVGAGRSLGISPAQGRALRDAARHFFEYLQAQASDDEEESDDE